MSVEEEFGEYGGFIPYRCNDCGKEYSRPGDDINVWCPDCGGTNVEDLDELDEARVCTHCGKVMHEGYMIDGGNAYYCSDECMDAHYTPEEKAAALEDAEGDGDTYWTEWEG